MMSSIAAAVVALLTQLLPVLSTSAASMVVAVINALVQIIPVVVDLIAPIKNVIAALSANPATTTAQMATLATLDKQCDDAFEAAAVAAGEAPLAP